MAELEQAGVTVLAWSNAVVEVSGFETVERRPLSQLSLTMTPEDPRWDPWLKGLTPLFRPAPGVARLWVPEAARPQALALLRGGQASPGSLTPSATTGWILVTFSLLYLVLLVVSLVRAPRGFRRPGVGGLGALTVLVVGAVLASDPGGASVRPGAPPASWLRHLWFQEAWPYGARWEDWRRGKAWTFPAFSHHNGRIVEAPSALATPDAAWAQAAYKALDPLNPARLFPPENP